MDIIKKAKFPFYLLNFFFIRTDTFINCSTWRSAFLESREMHTLCCDENDRLIKHPLEHIFICFLRSKLNNLFAHFSLKIERGIFHSILINVDPAFKL